MTPRGGWSTKFASSACAQDYREPGRRAAVGIAHATIDVELRIGIHVDGLWVNGSSGGGSLYVTGTANVSEVTIDITGGLGEAEVSGLGIKVVPRALKKMWNLNGAVGGPLKKASTSTMRGTHTCR